MIEWTENQRKIIEFGNKPLLVSASAGSGKTTVMLGRVMRLIEEGYSLKHMLISTFTTSAAEDMRVKLARNLQEASARTLDPRFAEEAEYLPSADICTLHKWCQKLIRKYFYITGDDPGFEIAEPTECAPWINAAIAQAVEEAEAEGSEEYERLLFVYTRRRSDGAIRAIVRKVMDFACSQADETAWLETAADGYEHTEKAETVLQIYEDEKCKAFERDAVFFEQAAAMLGLKKAPLLLEELRARLRGEDVPLSRAVGITPLKEEFATLKKRLKEIEDFRVMRESIENTEAAASARTFLGLAKRAIELYTAAKVSAGKFDFNDLERKAQKILQSEAGEEVRRSLTHVFIDEYQDINPLQEDLIRRIGNDNLFFVGDIKQSIYAFRGSTPEAFAAKRDLFAGTGNLVELNQNYRSATGILRFCNNVFSRIMTESFGRVDYAGTAQFPVPPPTEAPDDGSVEIYSYPVPKTNRETTDFSEPYSVKEHASTSRRSRGDIEAEVVTARIVRLLRETDYTYSDIVVLTRTRTSGVQTLANNLRAVGIPVSVSNKLKVTGGRSNAILLSWLKIADNLSDDLSLTTVMRSPSVGFSDASLSRMRAAHPQEKYFTDCVLAEAETNPAVASFLETVRGYTELSQTVSVGELAGRITSEQRLFATALSEHRGIAKADALGGLMASASSFRGTLGEYLAYLEETEPVIDLPPQPGSVRIMTVHAAKGLEFPVVFAFGLTYDFLRKVRSESMIADGTFGLCLESRENGVALPSMPLAAARLRYIRSHVEEEMRILYVMLTRSKQKLILFLPENAKEKSPDLCSTYADWLYPSASAHGIRPAESVAEDVSAPVAAKATEEQVEQTVRALAFDFSSPSADIKKSVTGLLSERHEEDPAPVLADDGEYEGQGDKESAMRRGTAYHTALEHTDFASPFDGQKDMLAALPDAALVDEKKLRAAHEAVGKEVAGHELYREQPFLFVSDCAVNGEQDGLLLQGVIDLLAVRGNVAEIIDYKTGFLTDERRKKYNLQLDIYAAAAERVLGLRVTRKRIYLIDEGRFMD